MAESLSYSKAGVDIEVADALKKDLSKVVDSGDPRVLNHLGAFASLVQCQFTKYKDPVLVLKTEEPGSKQKLAFQYGQVSSIGYDIINHLINDIIVTGAEPLYVQDCVVCGKIEPEVIKAFITSMVSACRDQGCVLVGGEISEQPSVIDDGLYILSAFIVGIVDKESIIDGSTITENDIVLAVGSNGLHTNGYSLVRALIDKEPSIIEQDVAGENFLDVIMRPHKCYFQEFRDLLTRPRIKGLAHITGGGIQGNLNRILPSSFDANIDQNRIRILPIFQFIREKGNVTDEEMLHTFNMGVGMTIICDPTSVQIVTTYLKDKKCECYPIGNISKGLGAVKFYGNLNW